MFSIATSQTHYLFNGKGFDQIDGVAIGTPLAPVLANLFLGHHENLWVKTYQGPSIFSIDNMLMIFFVFLTMRMMLTYFLTLLTHNILISNSLQKKKPTRFWLSLMCVVIIMILLASKLQPIRKRLLLDCSLISSALLLLQSRAHPYSGG